MIDESALPTPLAMVARRLTVVGHSSSADSFLMASYIAESLFKLMASALVSGLRNGSPQLAYRFEYELIRADGLGMWERVISDFTGQSNAAYVDSDLQVLVAWLCKRRTQADDEWARTAAQKASEILRSLGMPESDAPQKLTVRHIMSQLVRIRNKTKAHGAVGPDFFIPRIRFSLLPWHRYCKTLQL